MTGHNVGHGPGTNRPLLAKGKLFGMLADDTHRTADGLQHLGDEQAEAAITQDSNPAPTIQLDLLENLERGGERLDKDGLVVIDGRGEDVEIGRRKAYVISESAVVIEDAQYGALAAMGREAGEAQIAAAANNVYFTDDALFVQILVGRFENFTNKLMSQHAAKSHV